MIEEEMIRFILRADYEVAGTEELVDMRSMIGQTSRLGLAAQARPKAAIARTVHHGFIMIHLA